MDFDGRTVAGCPVVSGAAKICGYSVRIDGVARGAHRVSFVVTRASPSPAGFHFSGAYGVMDGVTGTELQSRQTRIERTLSTGQSLDIEISVP